MYKKLLVPVDMGREKNAIKLCETAMKLADDDAEITLLTVMPGYGMSVVASFFPDDAQEQALREVKKALKVMADANLQGNVRVVVHQGKRAKLILDEARAWVPDVVVIGTRRKASSDGKRLLGSCASSVADRADCSVLIVR